MDKILTIYLLIFAWLYNLCANDRDHARILPAITRWRSSKFSDFGRGLLDDSFDEWYSLIIVFVAWKVESERLRFCCGVLDRREKNVSCNCETRSVIFEICRSRTLRPVLRNEYGRGRTAIDGTDGRSCDVNEVEVWIRIGGMSWEGVWCRWDCIRTCWW